MNYTERFAPVIRYTTQRIFLTIAAIHGMTIHQLDVANAFIYAPLQGCIHACIHLVATVSNCSSHCMVYDNHNAIGNGKYKFCCCRMLMIL